MRINYHNKKFRVISNSDHGEVTLDMVFHYEQTNNILTCSYHGGQVLKGHLIGTVDPSSGHIDMYYHQVNTAGQIMTGRCESTPEIMANGKIRLYEVWQWTSGDKLKGTSVLQEL
ncbi:MAG: n-acetylglutamate synthase [Saprospiraceae bacterium]|nr:n-acetylglutamate synthase [Saprospiraceae bacterium]